MSRKAIPRLGIRRLPAAVESAHSRSREWAGPGGRVINGNRRLQPVGAPVSKSEFRNSNGGGFTLLEVLLTMAILAVILTVIYASFSTAENSVRVAEATRDETDLARSLLSRMSAEIANAYYKNSVLPMVFCGKKIEVDNPAGGDKLRHDSITLTTLTNYPRPGTKEMELWEVGYFFKEKETPGGKTYSLFRREKRELSKDVPALEGGTEYELTDRVESLQIRYAAGTIQRGPGQSTINWVDNWICGDSATAKTCTADSFEPVTATTLLPTAVEITVTLDNGKAYSTQVDVLNKGQG
jgi:general secretion pathway protein J